jgi:hypothetical protein
MRRLIYVPIIHTGPDFGTLAAGIEGQASAVVSSHNWQKHKEVVNLYWQAIASYWKSANAAGYKIFQDGMPVDGITGKNIVKDLAAQGSINHQIIEQLLEQGADLVQTEDPRLLKEEYLLTSALIKRKSFLDTLLALFRYKWRKGRLLKARDTYIIKSINTNLRDGETGICFLGASHQVLSGLARDIEVITLKDPAKVRAYSQKFTSKKGEDEVNRLGSYLTMPIKPAQGEIHE